MLAFVVIGSVKFIVIFFKKYLVDKKKCLIFALAIERLANASLAQLVEHDTLNVGVQGSSP